MGLAVERLPLTLHWKKLYISGSDYGSSHIVALQRSSERRKTKQGEERHQPFPLLTMSEPPPHSGLYAKSPDSHRGLTY